MEQSKEDMLVGRLITMSDDGEVKRETWGLGNVDFTLTINGQEVIIRVLPQ